MSQRVGEPTARAIRTGVQATPAWILVEFIDAWFYDMTDRQFSVAVLALLVAFAHLQALVENRTGKGFLRKVPPRTVPVRG
jgi:hypothetical protein